MNICVSVDVVCFFFYFIFSLVVVKKHLSKIYAVLIQLLGLVPSLFTQCVNVSCCHNQSMMGFLVTCFIFFPLVLFCHFSKSFYDLFFFFYYYYFFYVFLVIFCSIKKQQINIEIKK